MYLGPIRQIVVCNNVNAGKMLVGNIIGDRKLKEVSQSPIYTWKLDNDDTIKLVTVRGVLNFYALRGLTIHDIYFCEDVTICDMLEVLRTEGHCFFGGYESMFFMGMHQFKFVR